MEDGRRKRLDRALGRVRAWTERRTYGMVFSLCVVSILFLVAWNTFGSPSIRLSCAGVGTYHSILPGDFPLRETVRLAAYNLQSLASTLLGVE